MEARRMQSRADHTTMAPPSVFPSAVHEFDPEQTRPGNDGLSYRSPPTTLDTKLIIVTASLLAVLICSLCMHFTIRWALGRWSFHGRRLHDSAAAARKTTNTGMSKSHVDALPTRLYGDKAEVAQVPDASSSQCAICVEDFADGERVRVLPTCEHSFHVGCIDKWLSKHATCPTCRGNLMDAMSAEELSTQVQLHIVIAPPQPGALQS